MGDNFLPLMVVEKILRHMGVWSGRPAPGRDRAPPGPWTYHACDDVDATPDYENVLTD